MDSVVSLDHVSKKYTLGVTRSSVVSMVTKSIIEWVTQKNTHQNTDEVLWALKDINFNLVKGDAVGLIGQNGAGKSTLLKLLANITRPTEGKITINGRLSALIELGSGFHGDLTGRENIFLNASVLGLKREEIKRRFDEIVAFAELVKFIDTPVKRYSSGMLVRLGFAVASCIEPDILLVDEVLAVGDASFRQKCIGRIKSLQASIMFVSHDLNMVQGICSSAIYLKQGQIACRGITKDVVDIYEKELHKESMKKLSINKGGEKVSASEVDIVSIDVLDAERKKVSEFTSWQPMEIRVHYSARKKIDPANLVLRVLRSDGLTCFRVRTSVDQYKFALEAGKGFISLCLDPIQLSGGAYYVIASIRTENDLVRLATGASDWLYVAGGTLSSTPEHGVYEPVRTWEHTVVVDDKTPQSHSLHIDGRSHVLKGISND
ncbi:MAG: ABC transporter ATP-binding protein [Spirochaetota bacterium]